MQCEQYLDEYDENRLPEDISTYQYVMKGTIIAVVIYTGILVVYIIFLRRKMQQKMNGKKITSMKLHSQKMRMGVFQL